MGTRGRSSISKPLSLFGDADGTSPTQLNVQLGLGSGRWRLDPVQDTMKQHPLVQRLRSEIVMDSEQQRAVEHAALLQCNIDAIAWMVSICAGISGGVLAAAQGEAIVEELSVSALIEAAAKLQGVETHAWVTQTASAVAEQIVQQHENDLFPRILN